MSTMRKRKMRGENNAGLYQAGQSLSTDTLRLNVLDSWLQRIVAAKPPSVWLLSGPLGAGKTTLVQALGRVLGVKTTITSPTFSLQKIHLLTGQPWKQLVHIDAYRLKNAAEVAALELPELLADPRNLVVVEWPERLPTVAWGPRLHVTLSSGSDNRSRRALVSRN